jgi:hypothetical protein
MSLSLASSRGARYTPPVDARLAGLPRLLALVAAACRAPVSPPEPAPASPRIVAPPTKTPDPTLAVLLARHRLETPDDAPLRVYPAVTLRPKHPLYLRVHPREVNHG